MIGIIVFVHFLFVSNTNAQIVNFKNIGNIYQILLTIVSYIINITLIICLIMVEQRLFKFMIKCDDDITNARNYQLFVSKYGFVGVCSNFFYFFATIGLTYVPKLIEYDQFIDNQRFRVLFSVSLAGVLMVLQYIFDIIVFGFQFWIVFVCVLVLHILTLKYVQKYLLSMA